MSDVYDDEITTVSDLLGWIQNSINERDWNQFHNPKDLALAISVEAGELLGMFLWDNSNSAITLERLQITEELADVMIYCFALANQLDLDVTRIIKNKLIKNEKKYPVDEWKGKAGKVR